MAGKAKPVVGIIGNAQVVNDRHNVQVVGQRNMRAIAEVAGALPLMFAGTPDITDVDALLGAVDGILLTGARANVHPTCFGVEPDPRHEPYDHHRDAMALSLIKACIERGLPLFGICRGLQEMNVAFGGTLHPEIRDIPGRMNHRMPPDGTLEQQFELRHIVSLADGGAFHRLLGAREVLVNSLHGQGILDKGPRIVIEGYAPDATPEAIIVEGAPGFAMAVQWHPEWNAASDPVSRPLFQAFGAAVTGHAAH
ncbi:MAG TPA: gamma-glutamyl-gamma-aminobutyrate hydrolase family protein [Amaricoccus sp.]|nr:gamma-glutamyl-gamma-aminobutyrate hydrolase family protein [Amaricoccus sp.]